MEEKIIQIIPAPNNLYALYKDNDEPDNPMQMKIVCFALTDQGGVFPMSMDGSGITEDAYSTSGFMGIKEVH